MSERQNPRRELRRPSWWILLIGLTCALNGLALSVFEPEWSDDPDWWILGWMAVLVVANLIRRIE